MGTAAGRARIVVEVPRDLRKIVSQYLESRGADLARLDQALAAGELDEVRAIGHKLRGSSSSLGFPEAERIGRDMERAAQAGDARAIEGLVAMLREYFARVRIRYV